MAEIINIKNEAGEVQYPVTKPECVIDENGKNVLQLIRENAGGDWNAQKGEPGYIENKPFGFDDFKEVEWYIDEDGLYYYCTEVSNQIKINGIVYDISEDITDIDGVGVIIAEDGIRVYGADEDTLKSVLVKIKSKIDEKYLPNTVLKTTPQSLSDEDKSQVKENLGISNPDWNVNEGEDGYIKGRTHYITDDIRWQSAKKIDEHTAFLYYAHSNGCIVSFNYGIVGKAYHEVANGSDLIGRSFFDPEGLYMFEFFENEDEFICVRSFEVGIDVILNSPTINLRVSDTIDAVHQLPLAYIPSFIARKNYVDERIGEVETFIKDLQDMKIDREADDYYPKMAVGLADNLAGVDVVDSEINFRRSGGGAITDGVARIEAIKGNSVVWNQLLAKGKVWQCTDGVSYVYNDVADEYTIASGKYLGRIQITKNMIVGHKYIISYDIKITTDSSYEGTYYIGYIGAPMQWFKKVDVSNAINKWYTHIEIFTPSADQSRIYLGLYDVIPLDSQDTQSIRKPRLIDLTQMFGAGNEPTTIEEFYARIPMGVDLNAYNEGEVIHMDVQSIESVGVNQWDEEWEKGKLNTQTGVPVGADNSLRMVNPIKVLPNTAYYCKAPADTWLMFFDENGKVIEGYSTGLETYQNANRVKNSGFTTPSGVAYLRAYSNQYFASTITYNHDICINLSDSAINGKYFPYIKRVEDLSIIRKYFPQGMKSAGSAHDEIRYNKTSGKWEKVVRIGEVDMGTLKWVYTSSFNRFYSDHLQSLKFDTSTSNVKTINARYEDVSFKAISEKQNALTVYTQDENNKRIYIKDSNYTDAASFKAAMQGVMLYYELAEPIVTELDQSDQFKDLDYQVWNAGTEKAIAEGKSAPLAADITYGFNAIGKIKELESLVAQLRAKVGI